MSGGISDENVNDTENSILDSVQDVTGVSFDDDTEVNATEEVQDDPSEEDKQPKREEKSADKQAPRETARSRKDDTRYRGDNVQGAQRWLNARRGVDYDYDRETGNVVDKEGNVVFEKGSIARDLFGAMQNEKFERQKLLSQANELYKEYEAQKKQIEQYNNAFQAASKSGLKIEDQALAMQHMAAFRANPTQALRKMLHDYQIDGGDLSDIFEDLPKIQSSATEARLQAIADRIEAPNKAQAQQRELEGQVGREIQQFFAQNPEAQQHTDTLAHIIKSHSDRGEKISLDQAYMRLLRFVNAQGLDINTPLQQQLSDEPAPQQQRQQRVPMPGRGRPNGVVPKQRSSTPLHERRTRDLVREAMEESGIDFGE